MSYNGYRKGHSTSAVVIVALLLLLVAFGVFFVTREHFHRAEPTKPAEEAPTVIEVKTVVTGEAVQEKLRGIGELAAEEYAYTEVVSYNRSRSLELFGQNAALPYRNNLVYSYDGTIRAGVDFAGVTVEKDDTLKRIAVRLPKAKILGSALSVDSFRLFDEKNNIFNPLAVEITGETDQLLRETAEARAVENGLLDRADEHARAMVRSVLEGAFDADGFIVLVETAA